MSERHEFRIVEKFDVIHVYDGEHHVANCGGANEPESRSKAEKILSLSAECAQLRARVAEANEAIRSLLYRDENGRIFLRSEVPIEEELKTYAAVERALAELEVERLQEEKPRLTQP